MSGEGRAFNCPSSSEDSDSDDGINVTIDCLPIAITDNERTARKHHIKLHYRLLDRNGDFIKYITVKTRIKRA